MKLELLTNATVVDDAIRFVEERKPSFSSNDNKVQTHGEDKAEGLRITGVRNDDKEVIIERQEDMTTNQIF